MTQVGEGVAVPIPKTELKGGATISVRDVCDGSRVEGADVYINSNKKKTDSSGEAAFSGMVSGFTDVKVYMHFKDADFIKFITHKPRIVRKKKAISEALTQIEIPEGGTKKLRVEIEVYKIFKKIRFKRIHLKLKPLDYGHWWVEKGNQSFGWWPEPGHLGAKDMEQPTPPPPLSANPSIAERIQHMASSASHSVNMAQYNLNNSTVGNYSQAIYKTFAGVPGILNGDEAHKNAKRDPHHGDACEEEYSPVFNDCTIEDELWDKMSTFANGYSGEWSWRFEFGKNCHSFQIAMIKAIPIEKFKDWK